MLKPFEWRDLVGISSFAETAKSRVSALLDTDPLDPELEDRMNAVLQDDMGVELWSREYDKAIPKLQETYLRRRLDGDTGNTSLDFGQPCGASHISSAYTCRVGVSGLSFSKASDAQRATLEASYVEFEQAISSYSPEAQKHWKEMVKGVVDQLDAKNQRTVRSDDARIKSYARVIKNARIMAEDGPPSKIVNKAGQEVPMSDKIYPVMSRIGNMGWKDPVAMLSYTKHSAGEMVLEQNRPNFPEALADGRAAKAIAFYKDYKGDPARQARGAFGSPDAARLREVTQGEIDSTWKALSAADKTAVSLSGVDSVGNRRLPNGDYDARSEHRGFYDRNPDLLERRGKEALGAYLQQTPAPGQPARSAFSGEVVPLPGTFGPGGKAVIDHYVPLSSGYPMRNGRVETGAWSREQGLGVLTGRDSRSNMVVVENSLNHSKSAKNDWEDLGNKGEKGIIPGWESNIKNYDKYLKTVDKMPSFTAAPAVKTRVKAAPVPKAKLDPKRVSAAIAQQKAALQQAKKDKRSGDVKALESTIKMLEAAL